MDRHMSKVGFQACQALLVKFFRVRLVRRIPQTLFPHPSLCRLLFSLWPIINPPTHPSNTRIHLPPVLSLTPNQCFQLAQAFLLPLQPSHFLNFLPNLGLHATVPRLGGRAGLWGGTGRAEKENSLSARAREKLERSMLACLATAAAG
jgi:hypothetical protein